MVSTQAEVGSKGTSHLSKKEENELLHRILPALRSVVRKDHLKVLRWLALPEARSTLRAMLELAQEGWEETQRPYTPKARSGPGSYAPGDPRSKFPVQVAPVSYRDLAFSELEQIFDWVSKLYETPWSVHPRIRDLVPQRGEAEKKFCFPPLPQGNSYEKEGLGQLMGGLRPATLAEGIGYAQTHPGVLREQNAVIVGSRLRAEEGGFYFGVIRRRKGELHLSVTHSSRRLQSPKPTRVLCVVT